MHVGRKGVPLVAAALTRASGRSSSAPGKDACVPFGHSLVVTPPVSLGTLRQVNLAAARGEGEKARQPGPSILTPRGLSILRRSAWGHQPGALGGSED
jgi:hypothetical protein